jgi:uncharacterized protein with von Willebrand factor type A (vWA) domain
MCLQFFLYLRSHGLNISLTELLALMQALDAGLVDQRVDTFRALARTVFIKRETQLGLFEILCDHFFQGLEYISPERLFSIPEEWLHKLFERQLTDDEKALIEALGGPEALRKRFEELLREQKERHQGGNRWIGTGGTSPFGAYGYNPEGYRIGQHAGRNRRAIKVLDHRDFRNFDDQLELNTRTIKMALKRLRQLTREGVPEELDIDATIEDTSRNAGLLSLRLVPKRRNNVKVLLLLDVGGSMDDHIQACSELFSAARHEFKHLVYYYFHNCLYETVWQDNRRRSNRKPTFEVLNTYNRDWFVIVVGDAAMSPYELLVRGGSVEHNNAEEGVVWLQRLLDSYPNIVWLNPVPEANWSYSESTTIIRNLFGNRMFPFTMGGLSDAIKELKRRK